MDLGALGLIPVAILLIIAIATKKTASSMMIAIAVACILMGGTDSLTIFIDSLYAVGMHEDTAWIFFVMAFIGILVGLLNQTGASTYFISILERRVHSQKSLYLWSWLLIVALFIDDMIRTPVLGQLSPLYDKYKVPRASLAYLADATGTTFATLIPISSWAVFYQGVFGGFEGLEEYGSPFELYINSMPFLFYSIVGTILVLLFTMNIVPKLGEMKKSYRIAEETGVLYTERSKRYNEDAIRISEELTSDQIREKGTLKIISFFVSIGVLVAGMFATQDIVLSLIVSIAVLILLSLVTRIAQWGRLMEGAFNGLENMMPMFSMVFCAYMFRYIVAEMQLPNFVIEVTKPFITPELLPVVTFLICCFLTFFMGDNWGVTAIYATIGIPLCLAIGANPFIVIAATISGAVFGAHVCFYCDYTIFASQFTKIDNLEHAITQLPYGLIGGAISAILFTAAGFMFT